MKIIFLILTLYNGTFEVRSDGSFDTAEECVKHMMRRQENADFRRGDLAGACVPQNKLEGVTRELFGGHA